MTQIDSTMSTKKINSLLKQGGYFVFEKGVYKLTAPLVVYSDTHIEFGDAELQRHHSGRMLITKATKQTTKYNGVSNLQIVGGKFVADKNNANANVITLFHAKSVEICGAEIIGCRGLHSIEINACKDVLIKGCSIHGQSSRSGEDYREAIQIDFASYDGLKWDGAEPTSKCYDGTHCKTITITSNLIYDCPMGIGTHTVSEEDKYHTDVMIVGVCHTDVRIEGMKDVQVENCSKVLVKTMKTAHKLSGGKVSISPRHNKNVTCRGCGEVIYE